jgi:hypothetical protein
MGGHSVIIGVIDTNSRKYMPWGMRALIHLSQAKLYLFPEDFSKQDRADRKIRNISAAGHVMVKKNKDEWILHMKELFEEEFTRTTYTKSETFGEKDTLKTTIRKGLHHDFRLKSCTGCGKSIMLDENADKDHKDESALADNGFIWTSEKPNKKCFEVWCDACHQRKVTIFG